MQYEETLIAGQLSPAVGLFLVSPCSAVPGTQSVESRAFLDRLEEPRGVRRREVRHVHDEHQFRGKLVEHVR